MKAVSLFIIAFVLFVGCSGDYGLVRRQLPTDNNMTLSELRENWEDYHVYHAGQGGRLTYKILFDPKTDEIRLVGGG
jgi:hypothetical protein